MQVSLDDVSAVVEGVLVEEVEAGSPMAGDYLASLFAARRAMRGGEEGTGRANWVEEITLTALCEFSLTRHPDRIRFLEEKVVCPSGSGFRCDTFLCLLSASWAMPGIRRMARPGSYQMESSKAPPCTIPLVDTGVLGF